MFYLFNASLSNEISGLVPRLSIKFTDEQELLVFLKEYIADIIYYSAKIEGNELDKSHAKDIILHDIFDEGIQNIAYALDMFNNTRLYEYGLEILKQGASAKSIENLHSVLFSNLPNTTNGFRQVNRVVGHFISYPPEEVNKVIEEIVNIFNTSTKNEQDALKNAAAIFSTYEFLHPFLDGNGRSGRLLLNIYLIKNNIKPIIFTYDEKKIVQAVLSLCNSLNDSSPLLAFFIYKQIKDLPITAIIDGPGSIAARLLFALIIQDSERVEKLAIKAINGSEIEKTLAFYAFERYNIKGFEEDALKSLNDESERLRLMAYSYLGKLGKTDILKNALKTETSFIKSQIIPIMIRNNMYSGLSTEELESLLRNNDKFVRMQAVHFSDAIDLKQHPKIKEILIDLTDSEDSFIKAHALRTLLKATGSQLLDRISDENVILPLAKSKPNTFKILQKIALTNATNTDLGFELAKYAAEHKDKDLANLVIYGLVSLSNRSNASAELYKPYLQSFIGIGDEFIEAYSRYLIKDYENDKDTPVLIKLARDIGKKNLRIKWRMLNNSAIKITDICEAKKVSNGALIRKLNAKFQSRAPSN